MTRTVRNLTLTKDSGEVVHQQFVATTSPGGYTTIVGAVRLAGERWDYLPTIEIDEPFATWMARWAAFSVANGFTVKVKK